MSRSSKTGGNLEPMPFIRKWGNTDDQIGDDANQMAYVNDGLKEVPKKHRHREHSKSPTKKEKRRSRSPEKKRHKKRSKSREGKSRKRSHSRERGSIKREKEAQDSNEQHVSAFPPPVNLMQQVQQQQRQQQIQIQYEQQQTIQFKQEYYNQNVPMQQVPQQQYEQKSWQQPIKQYQQSQQVEEKPPANDALSAALAAAAMVAQKLNKSHGPGGATASSDLLNKLQQAPGRNNPTADSILAKEQITVKSEFGQEQQQDETDEQRRERRRKSRWSSAKAFVPGMPTILPADIDETQRQIYLLQMDIEETTRRLRQGDFGQNVDPSERSPSPEPIYDATGKRLNTREIRKRQELEQRRHEKIQAILKLNPNYKPPADYRPPNIKLHDKVWIPQEEHPQINFVGLLIGPRGNTLKALEAETGCKIIIRGKGSIKEGKLANRTGPLPGENEPLHAYVTATDRDAIKRGCERIREIVNAALMIPDGQNELRKLQLRELALLNGTLRPEDVLSGARCSNCGSDQHKTWECMEAPNVTANVICTACGGAGHIAKDCKNPKAALDPGLIDSEYSALMAELGEKPPGAVASLASVGVKPVPLGSFSIPGSSNVRPHFNLPTQTPIVRVNLAKPRPSQQPATAGYPAWAIDGPNTFYGFSGLPGQDPAAAAAAWAAWQGYPTPVPPPPGNVSESETDTSHGMPANTSIGGLAMFPPPPPPPPPVPKSEITEDFGSIFSAPPPPQS